MMFSRVPSPTFSILISFIWAIVEIERGEGGRDKETNPAPSKKPAHRSQYHGIAMTVKLVTGGVNTGCLDGLEVRVGKVRLR